MTRPKQERLQGFEDAVADEIVNAAIAYADARDARMEAMNPEIEAKDKLISILEKHGKTAYESENLTIEPIKGPIKVKVKHAKDEDDDGDPEA